MLLFFAAPLLISFASASLWTQLAPENASSGPAPRLGAAALGSPQALLISGGCSSSCCYAPLSDLWAFTRGAWVNVSQVSAPSGRLYHGASPSGADNVRLCMCFLTPGALTSKTSPPLPITLLSAGILCVWWH